MALTISGSRGRVLRALLSLLAGGGLSATGVGGVLSVQAAGAQTGSTASRESAMPITVTEAGSESGAAQGEAAAGGQSTHTSTGSTTLRPPASSTTTGTTGTSATPPPRTRTVEEIVVATPPSSTAASAPPAVVRQREQKATSGQGQTSTAAGKGAGARGAAALGANNLAPPPQLLAAQAGVLAAELAGSAASVQALSYYRIPLFLLPIYQAAAAQYGVPWQILAAINEIETDYGNDLSVSTAGAVGWMQFMPATWIQYGVDALNAGYADPYNPVDAIFAAARYLAPRAICPPRSSPTTTRPSTSAPCCCARS